jgi:osmotically-inducible protein OsmY
MHRGREPGRWARWRNAAVAAGVLGMVSPALAQAPKAPPAGNNGPTGPMITGNITEFNTIPEGEARLEEMKVELALLAEAATFSCQLQAKANGPSLVVRGPVPNQTLRDLALKVAREHTVLPVTDGITLQSNLALRSGGKEAEAVQKQAIDVLTKHFPQHAPTFRVTAKVTGEVTVSGVVPTFEDRLAVSRKLRLVDGCTSVVNHLQVPSALRNGVPHFTVTADGRVLLPASKVVDATLILAARTTANPPTKSAAGVIKQVSYTSQTDSIPVAPRGAAATTAKTAPEPVPASTPPPLAPVPKGDAAKAPVHDKDGAYVTTGFILVSAEDRLVPTPVPPPPPAPGTPVAAKSDGSAAQLKKRVETVCGNGVRDVEVVSQGAGNFLVRLKVRTEEEGKRASEKVLGMPEIVALQAKVQATVEP